MYPNPEAVEPLDAVEVPSGGASGFEILAVDGGDGGDGREGRKAIPWKILASSDW